MGAEPPDELYTALEGLEEPRQQRGEDMSLFFRGGRVLGDSFLSAE